MKNILDIFTKEDRALTLEELKVFCHVENGEDYKDLVKSLNTLIAEKEIYELNGKYDLINKENQKTGEIIIRRNKKVIIVEKDNVYETINNLNFSLLNHDEVLYEKRNGKVFILNVIKHNLVYVVGLIRVKNGKVYFYPDDDYFPRDYKISNIKQFPLRDKLKVRLYISDYQKKEMKIERIIGHLYDAHVQEMSLLYAYDIPLDFNSTTINEAKTLDKPINVEDYEDRKDLSDELVITIDGDDAKDYDDAISLSYKGDNYLLKVHIADVSHYVVAKSSLDKEAFKRGTSIYYPNHVIPMLPFELSNGICSLRPNEKRLAMTVEMEIDKNGHTVSYEIYESIIESKYRMTYHDVNAILKNDELLCDKYKKLIPMINEAYELSNILKARRKETGGIEFDTDESYIKIENDEVVDVTVRQRGIAEGIIEDFMIAANVCVANHMKYLEYPMIYRNHDNPKDDRLAEFVNFVENLGYHFKGNKKAIHAKQLSDCLDYYKDEKSYPIIANYCLRSMAKAKYDSVSGSHFGLGLENYCHFTSPIRRYPDLIVHRMIKKYIIAKPDFSNFDNDFDANAKIAQRCNERERISVELERDLEDYYKCQYMKHHIGEVYEGVISSITSFGFYVKLDNTVEGLVHIKNLDGYFELLKDGSLSNGEKTYRIGDIVKIKCRDVDVVRNNIDFVLYKKRQQKWI